MTGLLNDLRFAARLLRRRPTTSAVIVLTLGVGIAANTVMFSGFDAWALRPLPFTAPERLAALVENHAATGKTDYSVSPADLRDWQEHLRSFTAIGAFRSEMFNFHNQDDPERIHGAVISASLFPLLGIEPAVGRGFTAAEARPGGPAVALIGHSLWKQRFGADPNVAGATFRLDGRVHEVIGVLPGDFKFPRFAEVWTPLTDDADALPRDRHSLRVVGRLAPGVTLAKANGELEALATTLARDHPETHRGWSAAVRPLRDEFVPEVVQVALAASMASALLVLLIICVNVANLMLAQTTARQRETAVRAALGASRLRLVLQYVTESILLAVLAGGVGVILADRSLAWLATWIPIEAPYMFVAKNDARALVYTLAVTAVTGLVCALAPVLRTAGSRVGEGLRSNTARAGETRPGSRGRRLLVVAELAMSVLLAVGALLTVKSYLMRYQVEPGYRLDDVLTMQLSLTGESLAAPRSRDSFVEESLAAIRTLPGVRSAGVVDYLPESLSGFHRVAVDIDGQPREPDEAPETTLYSVSRGYLESVDIRVLHGRGFTSNELTEGGDTILVSESLARDLWPGESALGRRIRMVGSARKGWLTVVGVVGTVDPGRNMAFSSDRPRSQVYVPYPEEPSPIVSLAVHSGGDPTALATAVRRELRRIDVSVAASDILTMREAAHEVQWVASYFGKLLSLYAFLALVVATLGVYGVTADAVERRRREMGIRLALGATPRGLLSMVLRQGAAVAGSGVGLGVLIALPLTGLLSAMLFGVSARDPLTFGGVALLVLAAASIACYFPARRAAAIDPIHTLRIE